MATINLGAIKFNWKGAYNNSTAYTVDDVVSSGGSSYVCILASTGNAVSNATYWSVMSQAGTDGTDVGTTITTQGDLLFRDGSGLQRLAKGTAAQVLTMNSGATAPEWAAAGGGIISSGSANDNTSRTTTSTSFTKASNTLDLTVTPASTSSKFLITFTGNFGNNSTGSRSWLTMFRDSTNIAPNGLSFVTHEVGGSGYQIESPCTIVFLDTPNTTSQIVYSFQCKAQSGNTTYIGGESNGNTHYIEF